MSRSSETQVAPRVIAIVAGRGSQLLDVAGPAELFARCPASAERDGGDDSAPYRVVILTTSNHLRMETSSGVVVEASDRLHAYRGRIDTLLVAGGAGVEDPETERALTGWLRRRAPGIRRVGSVCTGAFALARAGLLDGRRAVTHWAWCEKLATSFPRVLVESDPIFVRDGKYYTSAGVTAGMDLALALIEEDLGARTSREVARSVVLYLRRPGSQSQFSAPMAAQMCSRAPIRDLQAWMALNSHQVLRVETLAERVGMSARHFARVFHRDVGTSPGRYLERLRVESACLQLCESSQKLDRVARNCGFSSDDVMRRAFRRVLHVNPEEFRERFRSGEQRVMALQ